MHVRNDRKLIKRNRLPALPTITSTNSENSGMSFYGGALPETPPKPGGFNGAQCVTPIQLARPTTPNSVTGRATRRDAAPPALAKMPIPARIHKKKPQHEINTVTPLPIMTMVTKPGEVALRKVVELTPPATPVDDVNGYYLAEKGATLGDRYVLTRQLGQGTFGKVLEAWDRRTSKQVAIKVIRAIPKYRNASRNELRALVALARYDPGNNSQCVRMLECFDFRNHVCIVTELLDTSIYDFLKRNQFSPFPGPHILSFARQLLHSIQYLHRLGLVHTDLKPENILLHDSTHSQQVWRPSSRSAPRTRRVLQSTKVTLIDFGSAIFDDEYHAAVVSTRHYRAPEIVLGTGWSFPCDMWSIGCVLVELCTGQVLFQTRDNLAHLHMMERTVGERMPEAVISAAARNPTGGEFVDLFTNQLSPATESKSKTTIERHYSLRDLIKSSVPYWQDSKFWDQFLDLVGSMLQLDPRTRVTAQEALEHPWFHDRI